MLCLDVFTENATVSKFKYRVTRLAGKGTVFLVTFAAVYGRLKIFSEISVSRGRKMNEKTRVGNVKKRKKTEEKKGNTT